MKSIMLICLFVILVGNLLTHHILEQRMDMLEDRIDRLQGWIDYLHGINLDELSEAVGEWQSEQKDEP